MTKAKVDRELYEAALDVIKKQPSSRADEWHIKIDVETRRRLKVYAAMKGLTLAQALKQLLDNAA